MPGVRNSRPHHEVRTNHPTVVREGGHTKSTGRCVRIPLLTTSDREFAVSRTTASSAAHRRAAVLSHLGPWPLKRSLSEDNCGYASADGDFNITEHQPGLAEVLDRIDVECKMVDRELNVGAMPLEAEESDERTLCEEETRVNERARQGLTIVLASAMGGHLRLSTLDGVCLCAIGMGWSGIARRSSVQDCSRRAAGDTGYDCGRDVDWGICRCSSREQRTGVPDEQECGDDRSSSVDLGGSSCRLGVGMGASAG